MKVSHNKKAHPGETHNEKLLQTVLNSNDRSDYYGTQILVIHLSEADCTYSTTRNGDEYQLRQRQVKSIDLLDGALRNLLESFNFMVENEALLRQIDKPIVFNDEMSGYVNI